MRNNFLLKAVLGFLMCVVAAQVLAQRRFKDLEKAGDGSTQVMAMVPNFPSRMTGTLPVNRNPVERSVASGAQVLLLTGANVGNGVGEVIVEWRPPEPVILVLSTRDAVRWEIWVRKGTVRAVIMSSENGRSEVQSNLPLPVHETTLPYAVDEQGRSFRRLKTALGKSIDFDAATVVRVQQALAQNFLGEPDPPRPAHARAGPPVAKPTPPGEFETPASRFESVRWTLGGPKPGPRRAVPFEANAISSPDGAYGFRLRETLEIFDRKARALRQVELPARLAGILPHAILAYDSDRRAIAVAALRSFYFYDIASGRWAPEITAGPSLVDLAYNRSSKTFIGLSSSEEFGEFDGAHYSEGPKLEAVLPGYRETFDDWPSYQAREVRIFTTNTGLAVVRINADRVDRVWSYEPGTRRGDLTYDSDRPGP